MRELAPFQSRVSVFDMPECHCRRISQLRAGFEMAAKVSTGHEHIHPQTHLIGELPGGDLSNVFEGCHAARWCNRAATAFFTKSGGIYRDARATIAESATFRASRCRSLSDVTFGRAPRRQCRQTCQSCGRGSNPPSAIPRRPPAAAHRGLRDWQEHLLVSASPSAPRSR